MIKVHILIEDGKHTETMAEELGDLGPEDMARIDEMTHELVARLSRIAVRLAARARRAEGGGP